VLSAIPLEPVAAGSTFPVTVATVPALPDGAAVTVTLSLAGLSSEPVVLMPGASTQSVAVMAPAEAGPALLLAEGAAAADSVQLNVLAVTAAVQVQEQVLLSLRLEAPSEVVARDSFEVRVSSEPEVPAGATVTVTVIFDETESEAVTLSAEATSAVVTLMAPGRVDELLTLTSSGTADVVDANVLQVTVIDGVTEVALVPQLVLLSLRLEAPSEVVARDSFEVRVSSELEVPAGATVTVTVIFDEAESEAVTLSAEATSAVVTLMAPGRVDELLTLTSSGTADVAGANVLQVTVIDGVTEVALVPQLVQLTLAVLDRVITGADVEVTVGVEPALLADTVLTVEVTFGEESTQVTLSDTPPPPVSFRAPAAGPWQ